MLIIKQIKKENETLKKQLEQLEAENQKLKQIASTLQTQYLNLSEEFEAYRKRISNQQEQQKIQNLIDIIKKIIPLVEQLRISIENIPKDIQNHKWVEGIRLTYKNLLKILESLGIYQKDSIGEEPNELYHEPISMIDSDEKMKGKIVAEHQKCYIYKKSDQEIVISPAKVIIGK